MKEVACFALCYINDILTLVQQVADLVAKNPIKFAIKRYYYQWYRVYIIAEWAKYPNEPNRYITLNIKVDKMNKIVGTTVKKNIEKKIFQNKSQKCYKNIENILGKTTAIIFMSI